MKFAEFVRNNKYKIFKTVLTYLTFTGLGGTNTLMGSSLLDLQLKVQSSFETVSRVVPARAVGYVLGASSCGLYESRLDDFLVLSLANLVAGIFLIAAPWFNILEVIFTFICISGFAQGVFDIYCNAIILRIWGQNGINAVQILHMCFGVGALITPVFTRPFLLLSDESNETSSVSVSNSSLVSDNLTENFQYEYGPDDVKVQYAFLIVGGLWLIVAIPLFFCYLHDRKMRASKVKAQETTEIQSSASKTKIAIAIIMASILANFAFGTEAIIGNLSTAFAVKADIKMDKQTAVLLASVYWTMFAFYRCIFMPMTFFISERRLFVFNLGIIFAGTFVLVPKAAYQPNFAWISFVLLGIGYSPVFTISYGSLAKYFPVSNTMTSLIFVCGVIGETVHTTVLAKFIDIKPVIFTYYLGTMSLIYVAISLALPYYCRKVIGKLKPTIERKEMQKY